MYGELREEADTPSEKNTKKKGMSFSYEHSRHRENLEEK